MKADPAKANSLASQLPVLSDQQAAALRVYLASRFMATGCTRNEAMTFAIQIISEFVVRSV